MHRVHVLIIVNPKMLTISSFYAPRKSATPALLQIEPKFLCQKLLNSSKMKKFSKLAQNCSKFVGDIHHQVHGSAKEDSKSNLSLSPSFFPLSACFSLVFICLTLMLQILFRVFFFVPVHDLALHNIHKPHQAKTWPSQPPSLP